MPKMKVQSDPLDSHQVVIGPCPGCDLWTLQYSRLEVVDIFITNQRFRDYVESLLQEHLDECRGLQEIVHNTL